MKDKIRCGICGHEAYDLTSHVINFHKMKTKVYKEQYGKLISSIVEEKRRETCLKVHGDANYKNREAITLSNEIYEGGHSLRDPEIREKGRKTKKELYDDPNFTNREKAKETCLEKYGYEYTCQVPEVIEKRKKTSIERYGKVINISEPPNKTKVPEDFEKKYKEGLQISKLALIYNVSEPTVNRWIDEEKLQRTYVMQKERVIEDDYTIITSYFEECKKQNKVLSFYEYGKLRGVNYCLKMKRLFNAGKRYQELKEELFEVALDENKQISFLNKIR